MVKKCTAVKTCKPKTAQKTGTAQSGKRSTAKTTSRTVRTVPAKQVSKRSAEKSTSVAVTKELFRNAKAIEITEGSVSVTHSASRNKKGSFEKTERRRYMPKTDETLAAANAAIRNGNVKKVRVEFKG